MCFARSATIPFKDLTPISQVLELWVRGSGGLAGKTFAEFVALAKADPKFALFASPVDRKRSACSGPAACWPDRREKLEAPFGSGRGRRHDTLLSNSVPSTILTLGELTNLHQSGKARILATFTPVRTADLPDVPTFTELGYPRCRRPARLRCSARPEWIRH
jgi:tripartite-type tricarboxylate transporter receptor subunit TctC